MNSSIDPQLGPAARPPRRSVVLVGFSGSGKSTVAKILARRWEWPLVDTDAAVEREAGKTISAIFADDGEAAFRALEARVVQRAVVGPVAVIATGGGALLDPTTRAAAQGEATVVVLAVDFETVCKRLRVASDRPLLASGVDDAMARAKAASLFSARRDFYASFPVQIDATSGEPQDVADKICKRLALLPSTPPSSE